MIPEFIEDSLCFVLMGFADDAINEWRVMTLDSAEFAFWRFF